MGTNTITKLEAAKRQLDCAIRLYFHDDDMSSTITLSRAAFRLLWDLYPTLSDDGFEKPLGKLISVLGWSRFNEITNFLKHADKDPEAQMEPHEVNAMSGIGFSIILYGRITEGSLTAEMKAWETIMTLAQPDVWDSYPDPDHPQYADFLRGVEKYRIATREERLEMGRGLLQGFRRVERGMDPGYAF